MYDENKVYNIQVFGDVLNSLKYLEKWLYNGAFQDAHNHPNKIRDWANWLNQKFFSNIDVSEEQNKEHYIKVLEQLKHLTSLQAQKDQKMNDLVGSIFSQLRTELKLEHSKTVKPKMNR